MKVNEIFGPTIQGEGKTMGKPVIFLRLSTCNLHCIWCDTPYTWNWIGTPYAHPKKFDPALEIHEMSPESIMGKLLELSRVIDPGMGGIPASPVRALVISGGEPLIQQKQLVPLLKLLKFAGWWVEIETNGTIAPSPEVCELVSQFNCSPKLSNSGDDRKLRVRSKALEALAQNPKVYFKFVIANKTDIDEVLEYTTTFNMTRVYLMPLGMTREELDRTREQTKDLCARFGFQFSDRLHVVEFGGIRAV